MAGGVAVEEVIGMAGGVAIGPAVPGLAPGACMGSPPDWRTAVGE
jgi:hypothetical protein